MKKSQSGLHDSIRTYVTCLSTKDVADNNILEFAFIF